MTAPMDILGRPPVMRPLERGIADGWTPLKRQTRGGVMVTMVPTAAISLESRCATISLPTAPWEVEA